MATTARTGVEMEALTAAAVAALNVYDMVKGIDPGPVIDVRAAAVEGQGPGDGCRDPVSPRELEISAAAPARPPMDGILAAVARRQEQGFDAVWWADHLLHWFPTSIWVPDLVPQAADAGRARTSGWTRSRSSPRAPPPPTA